MKVKKKTITVDLEALKAARQKYLRLGREIEEKELFNAGFTHSKLGIFLGDTIGHDLWQAIDNNEL